jgi:hypothetical protein
MELSIEVALLLIGILSAAGLWGWKKYQKWSADGKITLDEVLADGHEIIDKIEEVKDEIEDAIKGETEEEIDGDKSE